MNKILTLYHGSDHIIERPMYHKGKATNDYGYGFYCTENIDLAKEWAAKRRDAQGIVNEYVLDISALKVLDLREECYNILNWLAILLQNRTFTLTSPISIDAKLYILEHFGIDTTEYDMIIGYRADDSYFSFAEDFLNNTISIQHLSKAMRLGKLGIQHVLVSEKAHNALIFKGQMLVDNTYYQRYVQRDSKARADYRNIKIDLSSTSSDLYIRDIIKENIKNGDTRIQ